MSKTTTAAVGAGSSLPTTMVPRVLSSHKVASNNRKDNVKTMIASVQNNPATSRPREAACPSPTLSKASSSPSLRMLKAHVKDETLLKVKIKSTVENGKFYVPVSLLVDRELEMRKAAKDFKIHATRWNTSRLFREWRNQVQQDVQNQKRTPRTEIAISLMPEEDCKSTNQSHSFQWKPWLTTCIRAYYNTGTIRIPDECIGSDILLALEYFAILYSPDQLVFDSFGGYLRVKLWSDYFTHRAKMADWVVQQVVSTPSRNSHAYVTCPNLSQQDFYNLDNTMAIGVLEGDLELGEARYGSTPSRAVVHEFFTNDQEQEDSMHDLMRQDFCAFVQASLPGTSVSFSLQQVMVGDNAREPVERAVLNINLVPTKPSATATATNNDNAAVKANNPMGNQVPNAGANESVNGESLTPKSAVNVSSLTLHSAANVSGLTSVSTVNFPGSTPQSAVDAEGDAHVETASGTTPQSAFLLPDNHKTEMARAIVQRRITQEQVPAGNQSFEDRPHDEYTPLNSPGKQALNRSFEDRPHDEYTPTSAALQQWPDGTSISIDRPRETLQDPSEFVRSLSQKVIQQTLAEMNQDGSITQSAGPSLRPASERPFDEQGEGGNDPRLTEDDIQMCMLPSLPSFENDKDYSRPPTKTQLPFHPKLEAGGYKAPMKKLEVIGQITTPQSTPTRPLNPAATGDKPAPVPQIDLDNAKPCDGSVMSALSSPFDDSATAQNSLDALDARRPQAQMEALGGFCTPVDALSLADDKSVRIENQSDEEEKEGNDEEEASTTEEEGDETEREEEEMEEPPRVKRSNRPSQRKVYVDPDDESQSGCVTSLLNVICSPLTAGGEENYKKKRSEPRTRRELSDDDTPETYSETDEDVEESNVERRKRSTRRHQRKKSSDQLSAQEMINEIGGMADTLVEGIAASFGSMFSSTRNPKGRSSSTRTSRPQQYPEDSDTLDESTYDPSTLDETNEPGVDESTVEETVEDEGDIVRIIARPREKPVGKHDRPPLPMKHRSPRRASPKAPESSLERIQEILRSKDTSHHSPTRRSENVKRNLELLKAADAPAMNDFGHIGKISVLDSSSSARQRSRATGIRVQDKKKDNKKGLLGFLRKK